MRLIAFDPERLRAIQQHGSERFDLAPLARVAGPGQVALVRLGVGGRIGRHHAACARLLAVVAGSGRVAGGDGVMHTIGAGTAAFWDEGEEHETGTDEGLLAFVVEAGGLEP